MLNIGMTELLVFGIVALLVLGPEKLPEAARFAGKWYTKLKRMISNVQNDIDRELRMSELREQMQNEMKRIQDLELKMQIQMFELQKQSLHTNEAQITPFEHRKVNITYTYFCEKQHHLPYHAQYIRKFSKNMATSNDQAITHTSTLKVAV